jgi:hypothetical protein
LGAAHWWSFGFLRVKRLPPDRQMAAHGLTATQARRFGAAVPEPMEILAVDLYISGTPG